MMRDIPLNDFALDILNEALWFVQGNNYKSVICGRKDKHTKKDADYYTGDEYYNKIVSMGSAHNGFPEVVVSHSFGLSNLKFEKEKEVTEKIPQVSFHLDSFLNRIQTTFNLKRNALFSVYPPGGYISWHNNANASAYNFIFTYSETGDGYWKHWDTKEQKMVVIPDVKGWQCKAGYFGSYEDGMEKVVYHTAANTSDTGLRMTVAFVLDRSEMSSGIQDWVIEDIHA